MQISQAASFGIIAVVALTTFATRALPFLLFPKGRKIPKIVLYLGRVLTPAVIGMLVVYCLRNVDVQAGSHGFPELLSVAAVVGLHVWKRNTLLSIGIGTALYMFLIQVVF